MIEIARLPGDGVPIRPLPAGVFGDAPQPGDLAHDALIRLDLDVSRFERDGLRLLWAFLENDD